MSVSPPRSTTGIGKARVALETIHRGDPAEIRAHVADRVGEATGGDATCFLSLVDVGGVTHYAGMVARGDRDVTRFLRRIDGGPMLAAPTHNPRAPRSVELRRFLRLRPRICDPIEFEQSQVAREFMSPFEVDDEIRLLVYRGSRYVGWIGAWCRGRTFAPALSRKLTPLVEPIRSALFAADQLERDAAGEQDGYVIACPTGRIRHASPATTRWLDAARASALGSLVRALDAGQPAEPVVFDAMVVRPVRLDGPDGVRYLLLLTPPRAITAARDSTLSPMQRSVASAFAAGATVPEIARSLHRSPETIRSHLREAYRRLDVASRVELAARLEE